MDLDHHLTADECAKWLGISKAMLLSKCKGRRPSIPGFWLNQRVVRFHPRTVLHALQRQTGISDQAIEAIARLSSSVPSDETRDGFTSTNGNLTRALA